MDRFLFRVFRGIGGLVYSMPVMVFLRDPILSQFAGIHVALSAALTYNIIS